MKMNDVRDASYIITPRVVSDNAQANGAGTDVVEFDFVDSSTFEPAKNINVVIRVDGSALIKESDSSIYSTVTNGVGRASASITNTQAEVVSVTTFVTSDQSQTALAEVTFIPVSDGFRIKDVVNLNKTFRQGDPTIAWPGASFTINTEGGSGEIVWSVESAVAEIILEANDLDGSAGVTITARPNEPCIIKATDKNSGENDEYVFTVEHLVKPETESKVSLSVAVNLHPDSLLSPQLYSQLYNQWGDMSKYENTGWISEDPNYWSSEHDIVLASDKVFNITSGTTSNTGTLWVKKYYAFLTGE